MFLQVLVGRNLSSCASVQQACALAGRVAHKMGLWMLLEIQHAASALLGVRSLSVRLDVGRVEASHPALYARIVRAVWAAAELATTSVARLDAVLFPLKKYPFPARPPG